MLIFTKKQHHPISEITKTFSELEGLLELEPLKRNIYAIGLCVYNFLLSAIASGQVTELNYLFLTLRSPANR